MRNCVNGKRDAVLDSDFPHEFSNVGFHGPLFNAEHRSNLLVGAAHHQQLKHFLLAISKCHPA